jgi:hypothetical protein
MKKAFLQLHAAIFLAGFTGVLGRLITMNDFLSGTGCFYQYCFYWHYHFFLKR